MKYNQESGKAESPIKKYETKTDIAADPQAPWQGIQIKKLDNQRDSKK